MIVSADQRVGMLALLIVCLGIYGFLSFNVRHPRRENPLPLAIQAPDFIAVEFRGIEGEGIYFLPPGTSSRSLIEAVGVKKTGHKEGLLSADIHQDALFTFSGEGDLQMGKMGTATRIALGIPLDVNRASAGDLVLVPGIGEAAAARIVRMRSERGNFSSLAELKDVPGVKEKKLEEIGGFLSAGPSR